MYNQTCSFLPSKKQSSIPGMIPHNLGLFDTRRFSTSTKMFADIKPNVTLDPEPSLTNVQKTEVNLMNFVYNLSRTPRINIHANMDTSTVKSSKSRSTLKEVLEVSPMHFTSYLVGGFVGSKSQIGRRPTHGLGVKMWDMIRDLVDMVENNPNIQNKERLSPQKSLELHQCDLNNSMNQVEVNMDKTNKENDIIHRPKQSENLVLPKQTYADVAKSNLTSLRPKCGMVTQIQDMKSLQGEEQVPRGRSLTSELDETKMESNRTAESSFASSERNDILSDKIHSNGSKSDAMNLSKSVSSTEIQTHTRDKTDSCPDHNLVAESNTTTSLKSDPHHYNKIFSAFTEPSTKAAGSMPSSLTKSDPHCRDRITSECSADSEDSFIEFEPCDVDNTVINDDEYDDSSSYTSDDDSECDSNCMIKEERSKNAYCSEDSDFEENKYPEKKVRFAEGKAMVRVHPLVVWDFAARAARRGEWEMYARDSARFKCRIRNMETLLRPVLDPEHRRAVYHQRFAS